MAGTPSPVIAKIKSKAVDFPLPSRLKTFLNNVVDDIKMVRARSGTNIRLRQFPDSTEINADIGRKVEVPEIPDTPFKVIAVTLPDGTPGVGVISDSHLFNSEDRDTYEEENFDWGLLDDDETGVEGFIPASDLNLGDKIWLDIQLDPEDQAIVSIDIDWGPVGGTSWEQFPDPIEINTDDPDNPFQEFFHQIIAEVTDPAVDPRPGFVVKKLQTVVQTDPGEEIQITQLLFANLMMTTATTTSDADEPGLPLLVAIPWTVLPGTALDGSADEIPSEADLMTPWQIGSQETPNDYNFEMFNASEPDFPKVLILDGVVIGPNDDPIDPAGMPSNDTYTFDVADGDEIWVGILWDAETDDNVSGDNIVSVWLDHGQATPDDDGLTQYITLGSVVVDDSGDVPIVSCRNEVCGDIVIQYPPHLDSPSNDLALVVDKVTTNVVWKKVCSA